MSGGSSQPAVTQQTSKVELPAWVQNASQDNYNFATQVANRPLTQYEGQTVADPSSMTTSAYDLLKSWIGGGAGGSGVESIGSANPDAIRNAGSGYFSDAADLFRRSAEMPDISAWLNPYISEVENRAINNANISLDKNLLGVTDRAQKAGAFGGSREAIERGVTRAEGVRGIGDLSAQLRSQGFDSATANALAFAQGQRQAGTGLLQTGGAFQTAEENAQNSLINWQKQQMLKRQQDQDINMQNITQLLGAGSQEQGQRQDVINAAMKKFYEMRDYPVEQLNIRLAALGMSPYGKTETSYKTATSEDKGPDWSTIGLGVLKSLPALAAMSDRDDKTDIQKLGKDPESGLDMYAYRYKGDPKSYPKVVGPMAQDIEKKHPKLVKKIGGHRVVTLENLMESLS